MTLNLLSIGVQPSEIESMTFSRMSYYNQFAEVMNKAQRDAVNEMKQK